MTHKNEGKTIKRQPNPRPDGAVQVRRESVEEKAMKLTILQGDVFRRMAELPSNSIDLALTSPPYWGMRDYGGEGLELGSEPTMEAYLDNTMRWVKEVHRVLKPTGSFVLNLGDCFFTKRNIAQTEQVDNSLGYKQRRAGFPTEYGIYKSRQLISVTSFAYCRIVSETDFVCRGEHIWCKPNVPTPIRSRLKHSHEKLFWFAKDGEGYHFNPRPWEKSIQATTEARYSRAITENSVIEQGAFKGEHRLKPNTRENGTTGEDGKESKTTIEHSWRIIPVGERQDGFELAGKQNAEHIAPFPATLITPYIQSLCPENGTVLDPFLGSGTTMRVAMENFRDCIGIELNPSYVEYAKKRLNWGQGLNVEYAIRL